MAAPVEVGHLASDFGAYASQMDAYRAHLDDEFAEARPSDLLLATYRKRMQELREANYGFYRHYVEISLEGSPIPFTHVDTREPAEEPLQYRTLSSVVPFIFTPADGDTRGTIG